VFRYQNRLPPLVDDLERLDDDPVVWTLRIGLVSLIDTFTRIVSLIKTGRTNPTSQMVKLDPPILFGGLSSAGNHRSCPFHSAEYTMRFMDSQNPWSMPHERSKEIQPHNIGFHRYTSARCCCATR
jgi:hypothetical protein